LHASSGRPGPRRPVQVAPRGGNKGPKPAWQAARPALGPRPQTLARPWQTTPQPTHDTPHRTRRFAKKLYQHLEWLSSSTRRQPQECASAVRRCLPYPDSQHQERDCAERGQGARGAPETDATGWRQGRARTPAPDRLTACTWDRGGGRPTSKAQTEPGRIQPKLARGFMRFCVPRLTRAARSTCHRSISEGTIPRMARHIVFQARQHSS